MITKRTGSLFKEWKWPTYLGWTIFLLLLAALITDHYIFDPFIFGFSYYAIYILTRLAKLDTPEESAKSSGRILTLACISLLYMWFHLNGNIAKNKFVNSVNSYCWGTSGVASTNSEAEKYCYELESLIETYLIPDPKDIYE